MNDKECLDVIAELLDHHGWEPNTVCDEVAELIRHTGRTIDEN